MFYFYNDTLVIEPSGCHSCSVEKLGAIRHGGGSAGMFESPSGQLTQLRSW